MIRATGRRRNERRRRGRAIAASPARIPAASRRVVPELPQSRTPVGLDEPVGTRRYDAVVDAAPVSGQPLDRGPEPFDRPRRRPDVLAVAGVVDPALAGGQRREEQRPMADRLVAGQPGLAAEPRGRADDRGLVLGRIGLRDDDGGAVQCLLAPPTSAAAPDSTGSPCRLADLVVDRPEGAP